MDTAAPFPASDLLWGHHASVRVCSCDPHPVIQESVLPHESVQLYEVENEEMVYIRKAGSFVSY